jgi:YesN/AraC family two-component response regulator
MLILLYRHDRNLENVYSSKDELSLKWLKVFVILFVFYNLYEVFVLIMNGLPTNETVYYSIISLHVFIIGIFGLRQRDIYVKNQQKESIDNDEESITRPQKIIDKKQLILNEEVIRETLIKLNNLMQVEKRYRNEDLSLYDLATELEINRNYLSHILNENLQTNFYNFVNTFRIEEAKEMLLDEKYDYLSIEGIAKNVGFKSRNVFYPVFKKLEGLTPSEYKLQHRKNS